MSTQENAEDQSPGQAPRRASPHDVIGVGVAFSAAGLYFMLGATGYAPMPRATVRRLSLSAPEWHSCSPG